MLGLDTNVLVRFLVRDHEAQFERARRLIKREVGAAARSILAASPEDHAVRLTRSTRTTSP